MIQSIYVLSLITSILLFFLCFNVHASQAANFRSVPMDVGTRLTRLALVHKIDSLIITDFGDFMISQGKKI